MGRSLKETLDAAAKIPGVLDHLATMAERFVAGAERASGAYEKSHWGKRGRGGLGTSHAADPMAGPLVELGALLEISYLTKKGKDREPVEYVHAFGPVLPRLCYVPTQRIGGLVIVGGGYTVNERGIVG